MKKKNKKNKRVLITSPRTFIALDLARLFHSQGIEVYVVDSIRYHICSFSNSIKKSFHVPSPRFQPQKYINSLMTIAYKYQIDLIIPVYEEAFYLSKYKERFPLSCKLLCPSFSTMEFLHNKWTFQKKLNQLGFDSLQTIYLQSSDDINNISLSYPYILKRCYSRASQSIHTIRNKQDLDRQFPISSDSPWIAQEYLEGDKYCSYSVCERGKMKAHALYPVDYSIGGHSCLNFTPIENKQIFEWIKRFVFLENYTGQIGFDFIHKKDGQLYAIECNPRATSGLHLLAEEKELVKAFFDPVVLIKPITPSHSKTRHLAYAMILYGWKGSKSYRKFLKHFIKFKDIIFNKKDLKPFFFQSFLFLYYFIKSKRLKMNLSKMFTHDIDWNGKQENQNIKKHSS